MWRRDGARPVSGHTDQLWSSYERVWGWLKPLRVAINCDPFSNRPMWFQTANWRLQITKRQSNFTSESSCGLCHRHFAKSPNTQ
jgi:hypothetical protein